MIKHTQLKVPMTDFIVDVLVGGTKEEHEVIQSRLYDIPIHELDLGSLNETALIDTGSNGIIPQQTIFHLHLDKMPLEDLPVTIHELWHVMWYISKQITDFRLTYESHAFAAPMIEDLTRQLLNAVYEELNV